MNLFSMILFVAVLGLALLFASAGVRNFVRNATHAIALNAYGSTGTRASLMKTTDAAFATANSVVMVGSDADHVDLCDASKRPLGLCPDTPASGDQTTVALFGRSLDGQTKRAYGSAACTLNTEAMVDASNPGQVKNLPASTAGSYWVVGVFAETTGAAGPVVINDCAPYLVKIVTGSGVTDVAGVKSSFDGADRVKFV